MSHDKLRFSQISSLSGIKRHTLNARALNFFDKSEINRNKANHILCDHIQINKLIKDRLQDINGKIILVCNYKGGVGKSTFSYLLISALSLLGYKTCAVDTDIQGNLTSRFLPKDDKRPVLYDIVDNKLRINDVIVKLTDTLDILPSSIRNSLIDQSLMLQPPKHHLNWFNELCFDYLRNNYDVIIIDTPPGNSIINPVFALCLKINDHVAIPIVAEDFSLDGIDSIMKAFLSIRSSYKVQSDPKVSIVLNRFKQNTKEDIEMLVQIKENYEEMMCPYIINEIAQIKSVINKKIPLGKLTRGKEVYETIQSLLREFDILKKD